MAPFDSRLKTPVVYLRFNVFIVRDAPWGRAGRAWRTARYRQLRPQYPRPAHTVPKVCDRQVSQPARQRCRFSLVNFLYVRTIFPRVWSKAATLLIAQCSYGEFRLRGSVG